MLAAGRSIRSAWRWAFGLTLVAVMMLALAPASGGPEWFPHADKARHAAAFAVLWLLGGRAAWWPAWGLVIALLGYGLGIEIAQSFTATREASLADWLADGAGIAFGALMQLSLRRLPALR